MERIELEKSLTKKCEELGYTLVSLSLTCQKATTLLTIVVDRVSPIDMEAIVKLTHQLSEYLDMVNPIEQAYTLDISSLGAEKPLLIESLADYVGSYVYVKLKNPTGGENAYEGELVSSDAQSIIVAYKVKTRKKEANIVKDNIASIRLAIKF